MAALLTAPYSQFFDANGAPLAGGLVYTYAAGTTTPQASYTDSTGGTPASNPVVLDSAGRAAIWLSGTYKIVVKDSSGNTIYTTDGITPAGSSANTTFTDSTFLIVDDGDATKKIAFQASGITTATTRTITVPDKNGTLAMTSDIGGSSLFYVITDVTDISLSTAPTQANVGSTKSIVIPVKGLLVWQASGEMITATGVNEVIFGIRIGSTNYWPTTSFVGATRYFPTWSDHGSGPGTSVFNAFGVNQQNIGATAGSDNFSATVGISVEQSGIPTGTQTIQVIAAKGNSGGANACTLKGTVVTTRFYLEVKTYA